MPEIKSFERPERNTSHALEIVRDFSSILTHSLDAEGLLKQFLLFLREVLAVNRAAVFLREPPGSLNSATAVGEGRRLHSSYAIGLNPALLEHFELSLEAGIGGYLFRRGRILRRDSVEALGDVEVRKEFELLGAQVAVPILDREKPCGRCRCSMAASPASRW
jgi:GAF domain-containing protein